MTFEITPIAETPEGIQLHHIVAEGSDEDFGYELGRLARARYGVDRTTGLDLATVAERYEYLRRQYPQHHARMTGFARALGGSLADSGRDYSFFGRAPGGAACVPLCRSFIWRSRGAGRRPSSKRCSGARAARA